jgi:hypothetical protein
VLEVWSFTVDRRAGRPARDRRRRPSPALLGRSGGRPRAFRWAIADPPYGREWAGTLYGISAHWYPTPGGMVTKAMRVVVPGDRLLKTVLLAPAHGRRSDYQAAHYLLCSASEAYSTTPAGSDGGSPIISYTITASPG